MRIEALEFQRIIFSRQVHLNIIFLVISCKEQQNLVGHYKKLIKISKEMYKEVNTFDDVTINHEVM